MSRKSKNKRGAARAPQTDQQQSEIILNCVVYCQSMAAYHAGFKGDPTGNFEYAGSNTTLGKRQLRTAKRALMRLIALADRAPLSREEAQAKNGVLLIMTNSRGDFEPDPNVEIYVRFFALELKSYLQRETQQ